MVNSSERDNNPLISVIVPVYNVEKYIAECLDSLIEQTYQRLEIIVVDDCSPDNSAEIISQYAQRDSRIKAVKREKNGGLSAARNTGIEHATGEWITFVDSDDYLHKACYQQTVAKMNQVPNCNVALFSVVYLNDETKETTPAPYFHVTTESPTWFWDCNVTSWNKIFLAKHIRENDIQFAEGLYHEDEDFWFKYCSSVDVIPAVTNEPLYYYRQRGASITSNNSSRRQLPDIFASMMAYLDEHNLMDEKREYLLFRASIFIRILNNKLVGEEKIDAFIKMRALLAQLTPSPEEIGKLLPIAQWVYLARDDNFLLLSMAFADQFAELQKQTSKSIPRQLHDKLFGKG